MLLKRLRIFMWAAVHHPQFRFCYITAPLEVQHLGSSYGPGCRSFDIRLRFGSYIFLPWAVESAYEKAHRPALAAKTNIEYDEIPF